MNFASKLVNLAKLSLMVSNKNSYITMACRWFYI